MEEWGWRVLGAGRRGGGLGDGGGGAWRGSCPAAQGSAGAVWVMALLPTAS